MCAKDKGALSSYAYNLMMIHYLQRVQVLPVLQELYDGEIQPVHMVEGLNTWFQGGLETISSQVKISICILILLLKTETTAMWKIVDQGNKG